MERINDKLMYMKILRKEELMNVVTAYALQVECPHHEKDGFYEKLEEVLRNFPEEYDNGMRFKWTHWKERRWI